MSRAVTLATSLSLIALGAVPAHAELGASGTRLSVAGGAPRMYMTYGHVSEQELFAPISAELKRLQVTFEISGDACAVFHKGAKVATWPVIRSREEVPAAADRPFVLTLGSTVYVPLKRLAQLVPIDVSVDRASNTVAVIAGGAKPIPVAVATPVTTPPSVLPGPESPKGQTAPLGSVALTGVTVDQVGNALRLRVQASGPVRFSPLYLKSPSRIVIDFPGARWADGVPTPNGKGGVQKLRIGHPTPGQARLVLETNSPALKVSGVESTAGELRLTLGGGAPIAVTVPAPAAGGLEQQVRDAVARRTPAAAMRLSQSRGGIRLRVPDPSVTPLEPGMEPELTLPGSNAWQYIVIHHSATPSGNAAAFDLMHRRKKWDGLAYHFVINNGKGNPDGKLEVSPRWGAQKHGAHAGGLPGGTPPDIRNGFNEFGVGICLVGNFQRSKPTEKQLRTLAVLIQQLRSEFGIPAENVLGHGNVKGTACPGDSFPWARLFALMELPAPQRHKHSVLRTTAKCPWCQEQALEKPAP